MRELLDEIIELLPVSLIPYLLFGVGALATAFCFAMAYVLNRK